MLKIALAQFNPVVGDLEFNYQKAKTLVERAKEATADMIVFSELSVCGYPPRDLLKSSAFLEACEDYARKWAALSDANLGIIFGTPSSNWSPHLYNCAVLAHRGRIVTSRAKSLLPTYDVFDEARYFKPGSGPGNPIPFKGVKLHVSLCEECWNTKDFWNTEECQYDHDPLASAADADVMINISASPFAIGKPALKDKMLRHICNKWSKPLVYVNQVGGQDDIVFDGRTAYYSPAPFGLVRLVSMLPAFEEGFAIVVLRPSDKSIGETLDGGFVGSGSPAPDIPLPGTGGQDIEIVKALIMGTKDYARKTGFKTAIIGLSGGIDSALVASIGVAALGAENITGVSMPSKYSSDGSKDDAYTLAKNLGIHIRSVPIAEPHVAYMRELNFLKTPGGVELWEENLQARIRGAILMAMSNKNNHLLLTTGNKSELAMGYFTLYGDSCGGLSVIGDLLKTTVRSVSRCINDHYAEFGFICPPIPENTISKPPSAELKPGQVDEDSLPKYELLDIVLKAHIEDEMHPDEIAKLINKPEFKEEIAKKTKLCWTYKEVPASLFVHQILRQIDKVEYKRRQLAPSIKVTKKAFGTGRQMLISSGWKA